MKTIQKNNASRKIIFALTSTVLVFAAIIFSSYKNAITFGDPINVAPDTIAVSTGCKDLPPGVFCDDFTGTQLDITKWWYGRSHWGNGKQYKNNGVVPENVLVSNNRAYFGANGDLYSGPIKGIRKQKANYFQDQPGTRVGGIINSDQYFGSGRYEIRMKLPPKTGVCSAIWTFYYKEVYSDDPGYETLLQKGYARQGTADDGYYVTVNHEIDIEIPTAPKGAADPLAETSYNFARLNTWLGEENYTDDFHDVGFNQNDGQFHLYRFDWHTGGKGQDPKVDFYVDGKFLYTCTTNIPFNKGRFTIGTWFPQWAGGKADFDRIFLEVDWIRITPFNEPNDKAVSESFKNAGATKCNTKVDNDKFLGKCRLAVQ
jgi:beta-glucanase (GH16 family)